jgi:hypothetical protein
MLKKQSFSLALVLALVTVLSISGCEGGESSGPNIRLSQGPVSIRGWISDVSTGARVQVLDPMMALQRKMEIFRSSAVSIEGTQWASGGLSETGGFLMLDVPPGDVTVLFQLEGRGDVRLACKGLPSSADVFLPSLIVNSDGIELGDPSKAIVRIPGETKKATGAFATIGKHRVPVVMVPLSEMIDRREYPVPPEFVQPTRPVAVQ